MKTNSEIRQESLAFMKGNWGSGLLVTFMFLALVSLCSATASYSGITLGELALGVAVPQMQVFGESFSILVSILVIWPLSFSLIKLFLNFVRQEEKLTVKGMFKGFKKPYYGKSIGLYFLTVIFTMLWTLLLIVPGIIKSLSYALAPYILADNPELTANQAINRSMEMMKGHKMDLFLMWLGYMGFALLSILALGIPLLWLYPYYQTVMAKFYEEIKSENEVVVCE